MTRYVPAALIGQPRPIVAPGASASFRTVLSSVASWARSLLRVRPSARWTVRCAPARCITARARISESQRFIRGRCRRDRRGSNTGNEVAQKGEHPPVVTDLVGVSLGGLEDLRDGGEPCISHQATEGLEAKRSLADQLVAVLSRGKRHSGVVEVNAAQ